MDTQVLWVGLVIIALIFLAVFILISQGKRHKQKMATLFTRTAASRQLNCDYMFDFGEWILGIDSSKKAGCIGKPGSVQSFCFFNFATPGKICLQPDPEAGRNIPNVVVINGEDTDGQKFQIPIWEEDGTRFWLDTREQLLKLKSILNKA